jgi:hypothetical protein
MIGDRVEEILPGFATGVSSSLNEAEHFSVKALDVRLSSLQHSRRVCYP